MREYTFSIIIPHYNIPELLMRCLHSIPVRDDIQVIVVDDCSMGAEKYIADYPELTRPYLEFYSTEKGGSAGRARNVGLRIAKGKWVSFIDADDVFCENIEDILLQIQNEDVDIVFSYHKAAMCDDLQSVSYRNSKYLKKLDDFTRTGDENLLRYQFEPIWGKFFKKSFLDEINAHFDETCYSNDVMFSLVTGHRAKTISLIRSISYYITERPGSLDHARKKSYEEWKIRFDVLSKANKYCSLHNIPGENYNIYGSLFDLKGYNPAGYYRYLLFKLSKGDLNFVLKTLFKQFRVFVGRIRRNLST